MMLAIFIFLLLVLILDLNIYICIKSVNDTIKAYIKIGSYYRLVPLRKIVSNMKLDNKSMKKGNRLILNIISHSIIDHIYIAKSSKRRLNLNPIKNTLFLIICNYARGLLQLKAKFIKNNKISLVYDKCYENIDYYIEAHTNIISLICASIKTMLMR